MLMSRYIPEIIGRLMFDGFHKFLTVLILQTKQSVINIQHYYSTNQHTI